MDTQGFPGAAGTTDRWLENEPRRLARHSATTVRGRAPLALVGMLLLAGGAAAPAHAGLTIITGPITGPITLNAGDTLEIHTGGAVTSPNTGVIVKAGGTLLVLGGSVSGSGSGSGVVVDGGTVTLSGGSISAGETGLIFAAGGGTANITAGSITAAHAVILNNGGTANISGGSISGGSDAVRLNGGVANISGGSVSGTPGSNSFGVIVAGGTANITGGSVSGKIDCVDVGNGGTANISGGTLSNSLGTNVVDVEGGTANISGGSLSGPVGVNVTGGVATISGGFFSGSTNVKVTGGTANIAGCHLVLTGSRVTGFLQNGSLANISTSVTAPGQLLLKTAPSAPPVLTCPPTLQIVADPGGCSGTAAPAAVATDSCDPNPVVVGTRSDGLPLTAPYPLGPTFISWRATNAGGLQSSCLQTVQVRPSSPVNANLFAAAVDGVPTHADQLTVHVGQQIVLQFQVQFTTGGFIDETLSPNTTFSNIPVGGTFVQNNVWKADASLANKTITLYARYTVPCTQVGINDTVSVTVRP